MLAHTLSQIQFAVIDPNPSENWYTRDALPDGLYRELLSNLPDDADYHDITHPEAMLPDGRCTRKLLDLSDETISRLAPSKRAFWQRILPQLTSRELTQALTEKFADRLHQRFGANIPELVPVPILYRDYPGYRISVHPDTDTKVITMQFYLPSDDSQRHLGTSFHGPAKDGYPILKTNDFLPNAAYAFVRTDISLHSVSLIGEHEQPRNSLALTFYLPGKAYSSRRRSFLERLLRRRK
jgi:hypothetical protein